MRIGLFGGTFNPVHHGHLLIAEAALERYNLDQVLFIPAGLPPHKKPPLTTTQQRLAMLRLAIRGNRAFRVSDWEIRAGRVVYTYETVEHFHKLYKKAVLYFLLGSDSKKNFSKWVRPSRIRALARLIPAERIAPFASSDIRDRVRRGRSIRYLLPNTVERYIHERRLYRRPE